MRLSEDERAMLQALSDEAGESESTVVRRLIREAYAKSQSRKKR